jgi:hypothetical protein
LGTLRVFFLYEAGEGLSCLENLHPFFGTNVKKQTNSTIKAHLIRGAFYLLTLVTVCAIPFALAPRAISAPAATNISQTVQLQLPHYIVTGPQPTSAF